MTAWVSASPHAQIEESARTAKVSIPPEEDPPLAPTHVTAGPNPSLKIQYGLRR